MTFRFRNIWCICSPMAQHFNSIRAKLLLAEHLQNLQLRAAVVISQHSRRIREQHECYSRVRNSIKCADLQLQLHCITLAKSLNTELVLGELCAYKSLSSFKLSQPFGSRSFRERTAHDLSDSPRLCSTEISDYFFLLRCLSISLYVYPSIFLIVVSVVYFNYLSYISNQAISLIYLTSKSIS